MIVAIRDQVVIKREKEEEKRSKGGLYMPSLDTKKNITGTVLTTGSGRVTMNGSVVPLDVKTGDTVLFNPNMATEAEDGDTAVYILREDNVLCVWRS